MDNSTPASLDNGDSDMVGAAPVEDDCTSNNAAFELLKRTVDACASKYPIQPSQPSTFLSFALLEARPTVSVEVPFDAVVDVINDISTATVNARLRDVQFGLVKRTSKAGRDLESLYGIVVDIDRPTMDILLDVERAGVPVPTFTFPTAHGFKLGYVATQAVSMPMFAELARRLTLAFDGGDPTSWEPHQMQRMPACLKVTEAGIVPVTFAARQTNGTAFSPDPDAAPFPYRVARALGASGVDKGARRLIREYLEGLGIPAPEGPGRELYTACPDSPAHDSACCYVNVADDGELWLHCLGGHNGEGPKHWTEAGLADLAGAATGEDPGNDRFHPVRHLPVTPAAVSYIEHRLRSWTRVEVEAAAFIWMRAVARREARGVVEIEEVLAVYRTRLDGVNGLPPMASYFERGLGRLVHDAPDGRVLDVTSSRGANLKTNATELKSTALWSPQLVQDDAGVGVVAGWAEDATSLLNKLSLGHAHVLAALGVAAVTTYALPIALVEEEWRIDTKTLHIEATTVRETFDNVDEIDAVAFFLDLYRNDRLPLASENDVLLFVSLLAAPLLRDVAPGHLGVWWFVGPPGSGKDFMAEMARRVWESSASTKGVSFDLNLAGELELKRSLEMASGRIFARAKEAGKRPGMAELLIRLAGTDEVTVRGLYKNDTTIPNSFTYVAESAEDLPERREIFRRTVQINVTHMPDTTSKGEVLEEVKAAGRGIIKNLKTLVESRSREFYLNQADTGSRPLVPAALTKLLGATLPPVEGEDLTEIFETMAAFTMSPEGITEGKSQLEIMKKHQGKEAIELVTLPSYRLSLFIDVMSVKPGNAELFSPYAKKSRELLSRIKRESDYRVSCASKGYLAVSIGDRPYALRLFQRSFVLLPELEFTTKMAAARAATGSTNGAGVAPPAAAAAGAVTTDSNGVNADPNTAKQSGPNGDQPTFQAYSTTLLKAGEP